MMRGQHGWAVACRRPTSEIYVESHPVKPLTARRPVWRKPMLRGLATLGETLAIGMRAMMIAANQSQEEDQQLSRRQMAISIALAVAAVIGLFIVLPNVIAVLGEDAGRNSAASHVKEALIRLGLFVGYLLLIGRMKEIRRVFQYHGAEHMTIAAYEANEPVLEPAAVEKYSTIHVRCGTNFLILVMLLTIVTTSFFGRPALWLQIVERVGVVALVTMVSYELLRLGAAHLENPVVRAIMAPGLWLQKITTRRPEPDMIEVAIRSFQAVLPEAERAKVAPLPSRVVVGNSLEAEDPGAADRSAHAMGIDGEEPPQRPD